MINATTTPTDEPDLSEAERDALFAELAGKRDATTGLVVTETDDDDEPTGTTESPVAETATSTAAPAATPAAAPAASAPAPASAPAAAVAQPRKSLDDMTTEELRAHATQMEHERVSAVGRAAKLQRDADNAKRAATRSPATRKELAETDRLGTAFPELKEAVDYELDGRIAAVRQELEVRARNDRLDAMAAAVGDRKWDVVMQSDEFHHWLSQQPADVQGKYESSSIADYAELYRGFKSTTSPPTTETSEPTEAEKLQAQRDKRLKASGGRIQGRPSVGGNTTGEPDADTDPDALFAHLSRQRDKREGRAPR